MFLLARRIGKLGENASKLQQTRIQGAIDQFSTGFWYLGRIAW